MRGDDHPIAEVKAVRLEPLDAGVELESAASLIPGALDEPIEETFAVPFGPPVVERHEIVYEPE